MAGEERKGEQSRGYVLICRVRKVEDKIKAVILLTGDGRAGKGKVRSGTNDTVALDCCAHLRCIRPLLQIVKTTTRESVWRLLWERRETGRLKGDNVGSQYYRLGEGGSSGGYGRDRGETWELEGNSICHRGTGRLTWRPWEEQDPGEEEGVQVRWLLKVTFQEREKKKVTKRGYEKKKE